MAEIQLKEVSKTYDNGTKALQNIDLTIPDQDFLVLLGPSGCGKSTMLRVIAGLERVTQGQVIFDGKDVSNVDPKDRNVSMVFQNFALYPHLNVYKNIAFPLKSMKMPVDEIQRRVEKTAELLDITHVLNRRPRVLSGGQRQRVALGRAMVREPVVFLLDEPLSNLDIKMRTDLRNEICSLHQKLKTTFVYVTHDQEEAMHMGRHIAVMDQGRIIQLGSPQDVYNYPNCMYVAGFVGSPKMNFFATRLRQGPGGWSVPLLGAELSLPPERLPLDLDGLVHGMKVVAGIRPEELQLTQPGQTPDFRAVAQRIVPMGASLHVQAEVEGHSFLTVLHNHTGVNPGDTLELSVNRWCIHLFDADTEQALCRPVYKEEAHETLV